MENTATISFCISNDSDNIEYDIIPEKDDIMFNNIINFLITKTTYYKILSGEES